MEPFKTKLTVGDGFTLLCKFRVLLRFVVEGIHYLWNFVVIDQGKQFEFLLGNDFLTAFSILLLPRSTNQDRKLLPLFTSEGKERLKNLKSWFVDRELNELTNVDETEEVSVFSFQGSPSILKQSQENDLMLVRL